MAQQFFSENQRDYHRSQQTFHSEQSKHHKELANIIDLHLFIQKQANTFLPVSHTYSDFTWNGRFSLQTGIIFSENDGKFYKSPSGFATAHMKSLIAIGLYGGDVKLYKGTNGWNEVKIALDTGKKVKLDTYRIWKKVHESE
jgi:hypothetical protein